MGVHLIVALGKVVALTMTLALFSMTTRLNEIVLLIKPSNSMGTSLQSIIYIVNTTLAVLPSIQFDLQRAIDAETIRRGRTVKLYSLGAWVTILTVVLVRALTRAERLAEAVIDRGYLPSKGITTLAPQPLHWRDVVLLILSITPGLVILFLTL
jgi:energy-coupling factor transporter transmembrane protein EcfT